MRRRWLSISPTGDVSTRHVSELTSDVGSSVNPAISVTTRAEPNGVLVTADVGGHHRAGDEHPLVVDRQPSARRPTRARTRRRTTG